MRRLVLAALLALGGCVAPPPPVLPKSIPAAAVERATLWYVGLGLFGESWSTGDVVDLAGRLEAVSPLRTRPAVLHDAAIGQAAVVPILSRIAAEAQPDDVVLVYVSTHGAPGLLGRSTEGRDLRPVGEEELQSWLAPLGARPTILILSACFSGSFIPALRTENRIIITAARADRTSFGCRAGAEHTVFGEALLGALQPGASLRQVVQSTRATVSQAEHALGVTQPSQPQVWVGGAVTRLYDAPLF